MEPEMVFTAEKINGAYDYLGGFKEFARKRMIRLHSEYLSKDSPFFKNRESSGIRFFHTFDNNDRNHIPKLELIFDYGYGSSGSYETEHISLEDITLSDEKWEEYMKDMKYAKDNKIALEQAANERHAKEKRLAEYLKLRDEFEKDF